MEHGDPTLEEFKGLLREQFFALILDPEDGEVTGERARRLARIESLMGAPARVAGRDE